MATVVLTSTQRIQLGLFLLSAEIQNRDTRTTSTHQSWPFFIVMIVVETGSFYNVGWPHDFEQSCSLILRNMTLTKITPQYHPRTVSVYFSTHRILSIT